MADIDPQGKIFADSNQLVQKQFSTQADGYKTSAVHARGQDLGWLVGQAALTGQERILDVGTGAGHTAFAFAQASREVVGLDLTARMVHNATELASQRGLTNVSFIVGDAVSMPFPNSYFDVATCRYAAHHFVDPEGAIQEISRVLKPHGLVLMVDHIAPLDPLLDHYINHVDRMRDPSHVREWTADEWHQRFQKYDISSRITYEWDLHLEVAWWLIQAGVPEDRRVEIKRYFKSADANTRHTFNIQFDDQGEPLSFALKCALFNGRKT